jgi:Zn-dependent oligopeptidase
VDGFYASKLREQRLGAAGVNVSVPVKLARQTMLDALAQLYTVTFTASDAPRWHPDVEAFDVHDAGGRHLARLWCDWFARDGKRDGAWMSAPYVATAGGPHLGTVNANFARTGMGIGDVRIMWHEFGHAMHHAFTRTRYRLMSIDYTCADFIEAPSRVMENWPLAPEILGKMGVDAQAATEIRTAARFRVASRKFNGLIRPAIDLAIHRGDADQGAVKQRYLPVPVHPDDRTVAQFHHIFSAGYAAGHYAYQWAAVMDADLFTRFSTAGILDLGTGREYADRVLAPGNERPPAQLLREFLGRDVTLDAMLRRDGIVAT